MGVDTTHTGSVAQVVSWQVVMRDVPFGPPSKSLRVQATYSDGSVRLLRAAFTDRAHLDTYIGRFHPEFIGKEIQPKPPSGQTQP
jgi:hypothetical protein